MTDLESRQIKGITYKMLYTFVIGTITVVGSVVWGAFYVGKGLQHYEDRTQSLEKRQDKIEIRQDKVEAIAYQMKKP